MDRAAEHNLEDSGYFSLGGDELQEEPDTKPTEDSGIAASAAIEEESGLEPEPGAWAVAVAEPGQIGAGAPDPMFDEIQKGGSGGGDGDEEEFQQELMQADAEHPQPSDRQPRLHRCPFTRLQMNELENIFQSSQYPDVFARKELAIPIDGSKTKVQFNKPEDNNL